MFEAIGKERDELDLRERRMEVEKLRINLDNAKTTNVLRERKLAQEMEERRSKEERTNRLANMTLHEKEQALEHKRALNELDLAKQTLANEETKAKQLERQEKAKREAEKQAADIELKKKEDLRRQALFEQRKKDLENEGVVRMEREREMKWNNLVMQAAMAPKRPSGVIEEMSRWDPINNPLNSINKRNYYNNYRPMENRLEQSVPPYDLPKNYPIYGGNGYYDYTNRYQPYMPSALSINFGRKGRTGRRTNWEKFGRPSLRTARDMIRYGLLPPGYEGLRGNPASAYVASYKPYPLPISHPSTVSAPVQSNYGAFYSDPGPLEALARGAKSVLYGNEQFTSTPNQMFPTTINNSNSALPGNLYNLAGLVDRARGPQLTPAEQLRNIKTYAEAAKLINDRDNGLDAEQRTSAMGAIAKAVPVASTLGTIGTIASAGLKTLGWGAENFWPMHDAYQRFKTRRTIYNTLGNVVDFFSGKGYKRGKWRRRRRRRAHFKKGSGLHTRRLKFGGKIIPPKNLKKMFSNTKQCNCTKN